MTAPLYSIRMHSSKAGSHHSGAEHIAAVEQLPALAAELVARALEHPRGVADDLRLSIDRIAADSLQRVALLPISFNRVGDVAVGRILAGELLMKSGVSAEAVVRAMQALEAGAAGEGKNMRGAMLIDARSGKRLEPDQARGVRASRMDITAECAKSLYAWLATQGIDTPHLREAVVLATKVCTAPGMIAELCWSDDPDYEAGYVASPVAGYQRIDRMKSLGDSRGGRAFFIDPDRSNLDTIIDWLERQPVLIDHLPATMSGIDL